MNPIGSMMNVINTRAMALQSSTSRSEWAPRANGTEGITDIWDRLNSAAQTIELQQRVADDTTNMAAGIANLVTAVNQMLINMGGADAPPGLRAPPGIID
jgi:hypothetical protein